MNLDKLYLFNPFRIPEATEEEIASTYENLYDKLKNDDTNGFDISTDIEIYANLNYLLGEMIARIKYTYSNLKNDIAIKENKAIFTLRDKWIEENGRKAPAMIYFEAMAKEEVKDELVRLAEYEEKLFRFNKAYESIESKQNALKKKLEAIKYEIR